MLRRRYCRLCRAVAICAGKLRWESRVLKKLLFAVVVLALGFYVAWPAWSAYRLYQGLEAGNTEIINAKVDFAEVRRKLRPRVAAEIDCQFDKSFKGDLASQILGAGLKQQLGPQITDAVLERVVTPEMMARAYRHKGELRELYDVVAKDLIGKVLDKSTVLADPRTVTVEKKAPEQPTATARTPTNVGLGNIKGFRLNGPLEFQFGFARDATKGEPELDIVMAFTGLDWRVKSVEPRLPASAGRCLA
ncbi:MAG: DUF2939 domain-containing protein [Hyphomicrobiaceae bacterium]|nr:MAG: DUF2939 domain-containing protein [Hyphomicrobiaceae bacterium]